MKRTKPIIVLAAALLLALPARAERLKDICDFAGVRGNPVWGYGLVIGLNGTGDNSDVTKRAMANFLKKTSDMTFTPNDVSSKNIASVVVTTELPPFARKGGKLNVTVSAIGNCSSLLGGTLLMTELKAATGEVYCTAQGAVAIGGYSASGAAASVSVNQTTVGRIDNGGVVEKEEIATFVENGEITLTLKNADFTTAERIAKAVGEAYPDSAVAEDAGTVRVKVPKKCTKAETGKFLQALEELTVEVDYPAVVVINEKTGIVVVGENVRISTTAIAIGSLSVTTQENTQVSQPGPFSEGKTVKVAHTDISVEEGTGPIRLVRRTVSVAELVKALTAMGLTPRDLINVFQALREAGALQAQLKTM